jgi:hypothetical protein
LAHNVGIGQRSGELYFTWRESVILRLPLQALAKRPVADNAQNAPGPVSDFAPGAKQQFDAFLLR